MSQFNLRDMLRTVQGCVCVANVWAIPMVSALPEWERLSFAASSSLHRPCLVARPWAARELAELEASTALLSFLAAFSFIVTLKISVIPVARRVREVIFCF